MNDSFTEQDGELSDYGSDFTPDEEEILKHLLQQGPGQGHSPDVDAALFTKDIEDDESLRDPRIPRRLGREQRSSEVPAADVLQLAKRGIHLQINDANTNIESPGSRAERQRIPSIEAPLDPQPEAPDLRSPLERFRTKPRKALSVTDLISPSWCELQYWYSLTKHGKKKRTPAMKQGSAVHKTLEEQVHTTVAVDITSHEDAWGLRIWNIIQGLRTLRDTGMTRELEIWGLVDGLVVNGVIDELSHLCPDRELEEAQEQGKATKIVPAADQATITDFLGPATLENNGHGVLKPLRSLLKKTSKIYITDVKTRGIKTVPKGASFRPTLMQLMLYYRLLSDLATNKVDADILFDRYGLNPDAPFSDSFIAQVGNLNISSYDVSSDPSQPDSFPTSTQDSMTTLLNHNSLRSLWTLMIAEFAQTMPAGAKSIGTVLKAEYRSQSDGTILGIKTFLYDEDTLQGYLEDEMRWWRGEREAQGVCVEEAYKCGYCEFAAECEWRNNKILEATERMRRSRSVV